MDFRQLKSFLAVTKFCNFTKAAEYLNYSQSTVSEHVQSLEKTLGVKLFERLGKQICLSECGKRFLPYAEQINGLCTESVHLFNAPDVVTGNLTVAAAETLCVFRLPEMIKAFNDQYPGIQISLKVGECSEFPMWLRKNLVDIAFSLNNAFLHTDLVCERLFDEPMVILCSPENPLSRKKYVVPADLENHNLILTEQGCGYRAKFQETLTDHQVRPKSVVEFGSIEAIKNCVKNGLGISFLPRIAVKKEFEDGELVELDWRGPSISVQAQIIYHKNKWLSHILHAFIESSMRFKDCINSPLSSIR